MTSDDAVAICAMGCWNCNNWCIDVRESLEIGFACGECRMLGQHRKADAWCNEWEECERDDD